jgi:hypothetical protein
MIAQLILTVGLSACLFYVFSLGRSLPVVRLGLFAVVLVGYLFIWIPELTTKIAGLVGIGRGADLIVYVWIIVNLFLILRLHIKLREQSEAFTALARQIALQGAEAPRGSRAKRD